MNGIVLNSSSIDIDDETVQLEINGSQQNLPVSEVLCLIPDGKPAYTFLIKNNKKFKINPKDIVNNYEGPDLVRLAAYKYYGSDVNIQQIYLDFPDKSISQTDFESLYNEQKKIIRDRVTRSTISSASAASVALIIGASSFLSTMNDLNSY